MKKILTAIGGHFRDKYLYYVCAIITLGLIALGFFRFPNAIGRLVESCRDLGLSVAYTFCDLCGIETEITPTVNTLPDYTYLHLGNLFERAKEWVLSLFGVTPSIPDVPTVPDVPAPIPPAEPSVPAPDVPLPSKWEIFKENWTLYWQAFVEPKNLLLYYYYLLWYGSMLLTAVMIIVPLCFGIKKAFPKLYFRPKIEPQEKVQDVTRPIKESVFLRCWHWFYFHTLFYIGRFFVKLYCFVKENEELWQFWALLLMLYFNVLTITIEFIAYYVYFAVAQDFSTLYQQMYKLVLDLKPFWQNVSVVGWAVVVWVILAKKAETVELEV